MTETDLLLELYERTKEIDFSDDVQDLIEKNYVINRVLYTDEFISRLRMCELMRNDEKPEEILEQVKNLVNA
jgi:hypothetical protein